MLSNHHLAVGLWVMFVTVPGLGALMPLVVDVPTLAQPMNPILAQEVTVIGPLVLGADEPGINVI